MIESLFVHDRLSDAQLIVEVQRLAGSEAQATARLIAALAEFDARRLYLGQGCSSMLTYCTQVLYLAEHAAYNRIEAARAARTVSKRADTPRGWPCPSQRRPAPGAASDAGEPC